jgi:type III restriction enzyme
VRTQEWRPKDQTLVVPEEFRPQLVKFADILTKLAGRLTIRNADERRQGRPRVKPF